MDERQAQIRERAGLEESLLNVEFIEWLRKWGTPLLMVAALASGGYWLRAKWTKATQEKVDRAFSEYESARGRGTTPSPDLLLAVAADYEGVKAVPDMARLEAADAYLDALRRRVKVGAVLKTDASGRATGELDKPEDALNSEDRAAYLAKAAELYDLVYQHSVDQPGKFMIAINAMYGLAAVEEGREQYDAARGWYEKIAKATEGTSFEPHAKVALYRITRLDMLKDFAAIPTRAEVPKPPEPPPTPELPPPATPTPGEPGAAPGTPTPTATPETPAPVEPPKSPVPEPSAPPAQPQPAPGSEPK
ncbi:hypothetical protein PHYC_01089 [Phycisphaerales bacterium]|nr:hypothetical protein PHYC_01089 [Phycisphaerales bacterium]